jgi:hypothetical protein
MQDAIDGLGGTRCEPLHAACEPRRRIRFHQQMQMVGLYRELEQPEGSTGDRAEGALDVREHLTRAERGEPWRGPQRHMHWAVRVV